MSATMRVWGVLGAAALAGCAGGPVIDADYFRQTEPCNRACLIGNLDIYLAAIVAHDPSAADLRQESFRQTENAVETKPGEGIWTTVMGLGAGRRYADPSTGEVGYFGTIEEAGGTAIVSVRLLITYGEVAEAEWIIARDGMAFYSPDSFAAHLPPQTRSPNSPGYDPRGPGFDRLGAIAIANSYFEGIDEADGSLVMASPECFRMENGTQTVGRRPDQPEMTEDTPAGDGVATALGAGISSCSSGFANLANITEDVIDRRFFYDFDAGVVWSHGTFKRVEGYRTSQGGILPWLNFTEIFQIEDGQIRGIYAAMNYLPPEITSSGWGGSDE